MSTVRAVLAFLYDFVVGDDWRVALGVVIGLAITAFLAHRSYTAWWVMPVAVAVSLAISLGRARRAADADG